MDKQQARQIIKDAFESSFNRDTYIHFLRELLNSFDDEGARVNQGARIPEKFQEHVEKIERVGKYTEDNIEIMLFIVYLKRETAIERARTMQRNFVAWYLSQGEKDAALVAYVSPDQADWRFSLVKMDYTFEKTKTGKMKVKEEFTPARRWSFLVGENEKSHTAQSRLVKILADDEQAPTLAELEKAFDIETVTKEFFLKYRELFLRTKEALDKVVKKDQKIKADFEAKGVDTVNFSKKLLGQIVFLYFLQKKGWFGVGRDDDWGAGSKHFLRSLFDKQHSEYSNFFNDILEPLFYEALRIDRSHDDDYYSRFNCKIPFLNGGLFDPIGNYDWVHTDIHLPNDLFSNSRKTKEGDEGDGILDVFDRYNFTVREDEPLEKEVAIDPELLGKAYEKFNAIRPDNFDEFTKALKSGKKGEENKFNKKFGVYYTPREIVHYMCKQSLINYLNTKAEGNKLSSALKKQDIEDLIEVGELITEHEATALIKKEKIKNGIQKSTEYTALLPSSIRKNAKLIDDLLADIAVCDPAVGSGAFPVGMMNEIVRARNVLSVFLNDRKRNDYEFKRRCIEHSLYGVDIDPGAVEIAKLRLWLSLVVDEEDIKNIKPLPNLDYKIVCGNSLLGVEKDLFNHQLFNDLEKLKPLFFMETNPTKKQEYKKQIDDLISQITKGHKKFDFEVYFSEIFHNKGGFDVVIANPPYGASFSNNEIKKLKPSYESFALRGESYILFIESGIQKLRSDGVFSYIVPDTYLNLGFTQKIRTFLLKNSFLKEIVLLPANVFEAATVDTTLLFAQRAESKALYHPATVRVKRISKQNSFISLPKADREFLADTTDWYNFGCFNIASDADELATIRKIDALPLRVSDIAEMFSGIKVYEVGKGKPPQTEKTLKDRPFTTDVQYSQSFLPFYDGKHIGRYTVLWQNNNWIKYGPWLAAARSPQIFEGEKILIRKIVGDNLIATYDSETSYCNTLLFILKLSHKNKFTYKSLLAVLNSKLIGWYYRKRFQISDEDTFPQIMIRDILQFPLPDASQEKKLTNLVKEILAAKKRDSHANTTALERKIDQIVYQLYGLTDEEIKIVEGVTK